MRLFQGARFVLPGEPVPADLPAAIEQPAPEVTAALLDEPVFGIADTSADEPSRQTEPPSDLTGVISDEVWKSAVDLCGFEAAEKKRWMEMDRTAPERSAAASKWVQRFGLTAVIEDYEIALLSDVIVEGRPQVPDRRRANPGVSDPTNIDPLRVIYYVKRKLHERGEYLEERVNWLDADIVLDEVRRANGDPYVFVQSLIDRCIKRHHRRQSEVDLVRGFLVSELREHGHEDAEKFVHSMSQEEFLKAIDAVPRTDDVTDFARAMQAGKKLAQEKFPKPVE
jgi:hypothetical protein